MAKSKSAYSTPSKLGKIDTHIIVVWVDNEAGVLARVVGLFSGRGYNIESLAVAEVDKKKHLSRMELKELPKGTVVTIVVGGDDSSEANNLLNPATYSDNTVGNTTNEEGRKEEPRLSEDLWGDVSLKSLLF